MTPGSARRCLAAIARLGTTLVLAGTALPPTGCRHLLEPIQPRSLTLAESQAVGFPAGSSVRLENGYPAPEVRPVLSEAFHRIDADLRDWTARLVAEVAYELERRGVAAIVPEGSIRGSPVMLEPSRGLRATAEPRRLRFRMVEILPPEPPARPGPGLRVEVESPDGGYAATFAAGEGARGFRDALFDLKKAVLDDARLQEWIRETARPRSDGT